MTADFLNDRYKNLDMLLGDNDGYEPELVTFRNSNLAAKLLDKYLYNDSSIVIHADVDFDGIGSAYEIYKYFSLRGKPNEKLRLCINKDKEHGIGNGNKAVNYFNKYDDALIIIVDSSSNNIEHIKQINHDVLVIDHHELSVDTNELTGKTVGGQYCVVSNMIDSDPDMSCGMVIYELLRYYQHTRGLDGEIERNKLYQWAVCTLFTDVINTDTKRNLYYINKAFTDSLIEENLRIMLDQVTRGGSLNKSNIGFQLAPCFNRAIRAGKASEALKIAVNYPNRLKELLIYKQYQKELLNGIEDKASEFTRYTYIDLTPFENISKAYSGITAGKLLDRYKKTSIAYKVTPDGIAKGSFRGLYEEIDYRHIMLELGMIAEGHKGAFGFQIPLEHLNEIMEKVTDVERDIERVEYLMSPRANGRCKHRIKDMDAFKKEGNIWKIGVINSKISGGYGNLNLICSLSEVQLVEEFAKYKTYNVDGLSCIAFEEICSPLVEIYAEYGDELKLYLRNKWDNKV